MYREDAPLRLEEVGEVLLAELQVGRHRLQRLLLALDIRRRHRILNLMDRAQRRAEGLINADKALCRLGQLLLHLLRSDKEGLKIGPLALDLRHLGEDLRDITQLLLPGGHLLLKGREVLARHHALHDELIVL